MAVQENNASPAELPRPLVAVMSSGFFGFFAHAGFLEGLREMGLTPDAYAGCSSGALVAAFAAAGVSPREMLSLFGRLSKADFWDPPQGAQLIRWLLGGLRGRSGYVAGEAFEALLRNYLPAASFADCAKPCLMVALEVGSGRRVVLDSGPLPLAVRASGSVPALFSAVPWQGGLLVDGGLVDKAPLMASQDRLGAKTMLVHVLPSASLEKPLAQTLNHALAPLRIQSRAVDAARLQAYRDQADLVRTRGALLHEVTGHGLPRCGPKHMANGPKAFEAARQNTHAQLGNLTGG
jgi:NTE family protein